MKVYSENYTLTRSNEESNRLQYYERYYSSQGFKIKIRKQEEEVSQLNINLYF